MDDSNEQLVIIAIDQGYCYGRETFIVILNASNTI